MNTGIITTEVLVSVATTTAIATSVNADGLLTAAIGFGTALITMVGGEIVKYLVAYFKKKREKIEGENSDGKI